MTKLNICYSKELEINRINNTIKRIDWYNEHKYRVLLPEGITLQNVSEIIEKEFNEEEYRKAEKELLRDFNPKTFQDIEKKIGKNLPPEIKVIFTKYGVGGSYNLPNTVIINFKTKAKHNTAYCLKHEMIHLLIEEDVRKQGLIQEEKEAWVDRLMESIGE